MIVEISRQKVRKDAITVWNEPGPEIDIAMDVRALTFKENSIRELYAYHVLDGLFHHEIVKVLENWRRCLAPGAKVFIIVDDFEYVCRAFVGGDINVDKFNSDFARPTNFTRDNLIAYLTEAVFVEGSIAVWFADIPQVYAKQHCELIISGTKS